MLLSVGANDVGFSKIVAFCASVRRCPARHFNPRFPFLEGGDKRPTLEETVRSRLDELDERYRRLDAALEPLVEPERVLIVEYFDPTTAPDGSDCEMKVLGDGIRPEESRWARENVLAPLNAAIETAAAEHGWRLVDGVAERFRGHGVCAMEKAPRPRRAAAGRDPPSERGGPPPDRGADYAGAGGGTQPVARVCVPR